MSLFFTKTLNMLSNLTNFTKNLENVHERRHKSPKKLSFTQQYYHRKNELLLAPHPVNMHEHFQKICFLLQNIANLWLETTLSRETRNIPTCWVISQQLQEFVSRKETICSIHGVKHTFKPRTVYKYICI